LGNNKAAFPPLLSVRDLYMEVVHDHGLFQIGWKPHHFGLGMYYNDSSEFFSPVYNEEGSTGFISWRGFIGSSYYVQPMVHYINGALFNLFIQGGFKQDQYGIEFMYKTSPQGIADDSQPSVQSSSYLGAYGYYKPGKAFTAQLEVGRTSDEVYGGVVDINWQPPVRWLKLGLSVGASTANETKAFYFDPSFSAELSFLIEQYDSLKPKKEPSLAGYGWYSFHSAFYIAPSLVFFFSDSVSLQSVFSGHLSYSEMDVLLYHGELTLKYELAKGLV